MIKSYGLPPGAQLTVPLLAEAKQSASALEEKLAPQSVIEPEAGLTFPPGLILMSGPVSLFIDGVWLGSGLPKVIKMPLISCPAPVGFTSKLVKTTVILPLDPLDPVICASAFTGPSPPGGLLAVADQVVVVSARAAVGSRSPVTSSVMAATHPRAPGHGFMGVPSRTPWHQPTPGGKLRSRVIFWTIDLPSSQFVQIWAVSPKGCTILAQCGAGVPLLIEYWAAAGPRRWCG